MIQFPEFWAYVFLNRKSTTKFLIWEIRTFILQATDRGGLSKHSAANPAQSNLDFHYFRWCFGENLFFRSDGSVDPDPIHFWYPWLSDHLKAQPILKSLQFKPPPTFSIEALITAYTPGTIKPLSHTK